MLVKKHKNIGSGELSFKRCCFRTTKGLRTGLTMCNSATCCLSLLKSQYLLQSPLLSPNNTIQCSELTKCCLVPVWLSTQWLEHSPEPQKAQVKICFIQLEDLICFFYILEGLWPQSSKVNALFNISCYFTF